MPVLQVEHSRCAGAAFAPRGVEALRVGRNEKFHNDRWRHFIICPCFFPADDVAFVREDAEFGEAEFYMVGMTQVGIAQVCTTQVDAAQVCTV